MVCPIQDDIIREINDILRNYTGDPSPAFSPDSRLAEDFELNSFDVVQLVMQIENRFGIAVPDEKIRPLTTGADLIRLINELMQG